MFGHDDNQQPSVDNNTVQAAMPDPIVPDDPASPSPLFGTPPAAAAAQDLATPEIAETSSPEPVVAPATGEDSDLHELKQQALQHLSPLVNHLDQNPERKVPYNHDDDTSSRRQDTDKVSL